MKNFFDAFQPKVYNYVTTIANIRGEEESKLKLVLTILVILLIAGFTQAHETVCQSGCDSTSIQAAVYVAHPNDTIDVYSGTYNESVILTKNIIFRGIDTGSGEPIVNGDIYQNGFNMVLRGFSFQSISSGLPYAENMTTPNTTFYWIEKAFENPSKSKAIASLDKIIKANPKDAWALFRKGWVLSDSGRYEDSIDILDESIKLDPYFASPWNLMGNDFYELNKYDKALEAYEKAIQLRPGIGLYWYGKGDALKALGRTSESEAAYAKASELGYGNSTSTNKATTASPNSAPGPTATPGTYVIDHIMASNVDETTSNVITRAYTFSSNDSKAYSWLSLGKVGSDTVKWMWYSPDGNLYRTDSVDIPTPSSAYWPSYNAWSYIYIAGNNAANLPGDWHVDVYLDGQKIFTEYFSIAGGESTVSSGNQSFAPSNEQLTADEILAETAFFNQGFALLELGRYDEAIQAYDEAIKIDPQDATVWYFKGLALGELGKYDEANQAFDKAIKIDPQDADAWYYKGAALSELGKYDEANQAFDKAIKIDPQDADAWYYKGMVLDAQGRQDEAARAYNKSIEIDPQIEDEWWG